MLCLRLRCIALDSPGLVAGEGKELLEYLECVLLFPSVHEERTYGDYYNLQSRRNRGGPSWIECANFWSLYIDGGL